MPHTQSSQQQASSASFAPDTMMAMPDPDYALGCECADPRLTIEMWSADAETGVSGAEPHH